jgi:hypothetical protein
VAVVVFGVGVEAAGLRQSAADHVADGEDGDVEPRCLAPKPPASFWSTTSAAIRTPTTVTT